MPNEFVARNGIIALNNSQITGSLNVSAGITGSLLGTSSWANNAALLNGTASSVFATTGSNIFIGNQTVTGSLFTTGSNTLVGSTTLTGSLNITGSTTQIGNNNLVGNTSLSGSVIISGSQGTGNPTIQIFGDLNQTGYTRYLPVITNIDTSISASYIYVSGSTQDLYFSQNGKGYNNVTRLRWLEGNLYTGLLNGGLITTQSSTVYQISSGSGIIVNLNASLNDNPYPTIQYLNWGNLSASIAPLTASYQQAFVSIDSAGNIYQQGTPYASGQFDTEINIGVVLFQNQSTINGVKTQPSLAYGFEQNQNIFNRAFGPLKLSGYTLAPSGSSTGSLIVASGTAYSPGSNYPIDPNNPSYATDSGTNVSKIFRYRQSGSTWVYDTNAGLGYGAIDPTQYSNNGVLTAVPGGGANRQWSIQRVFWFPNSVAKAIVVYYGNATYTTQVDATANIPYEPFVEAPNTAANAIYLGAIIVRNDADFTVNASYNIQPGGLFRQVGGSGGGGSVITQTLSGLSDVSISGPTNLQPLAYSTTAGKWINTSTLSASIAGNASTATSASHALNANSASFATSASLAQTASFVLNAISASYAATASSADNFVVRQNATASNLLISGILTAQTIVAQTITSSTDFVTGSTKFGSLQSNTHQFTGSVSITGSLTVTGAGITGSLFGTSSWAQSAASSSYPIAIVGSNSLYSTKPRAGVPGVTNANVIFLGTDAGSGSTFAQSSNFFGNSAGRDMATTLIQGSNNFFGGESGRYANKVSNSNFFGLQSGYFAVNSEQSNFFGKNTGYQALSASYSTLIGFQVGKNEFLGSSGNGIGKNNIIIGTNITLEDDKQSSINIGGVLFGTGSYFDIASSPFSGSANGRIGINQPTPQYSLDVSGSGNYTDGLTVTGSLIVSSITGSLQVTGDSTYSGSQTFTTGYIVLTQVSQSLNYADDAAAAAGGVPLGGLYRNGNFIAIRIS